ncbi:hypothetical protein HDV06_001647 [Boothiomyces sp. JEL0866]|nr:hypothetical protein HDV06_001647 [Boothiomyces sp. JEL0866]
MYYGGPTIVAQSTTTTVYAKPVTTVTQPKYGGVDPAVYVTTSKAPAATGYDKVLPKVFTVIKHPSYVPKVTSTGYIQQGDAKALTDPLKNRPITVSTAQSPAYTTAPVVYATTVGSKNPAYTSHTGTASSAQALKAFTSVILAIVLTLVF